MRWIVCAVMLFAASCICGGPGELVKPPAGLVVSPHSIEFGTQLSVVTATRPLIIGNDGARVLTADLFIRGDARVRFDVATSHLVLQPGEKQEVDVTYLASDPGEDTATIEVHVVDGQDVVALHGITQRAEVGDSGAVDSGTQTVDAGPVDSGVADSGTLDSGTLDSGTVDAGHCVVTGAESCSNKMDDDCDGFADCADSDCSADPACTPIVCEAGVDVRISTGTVESGGADIVSDGTGFGIAWQSYDAVNTSVPYTYGFARAAADLTLTTAPFTLITGVAHSPRLAWSGDSWGVAWCDVDPSGQTAHVQRLSPAGVAMGSPVAMGTGFPATIAPGPSSTAFGAMWGHRVAPGERSMFGEVAGGARQGGDVPLGSADAGVDYGDLVWNGNGWGAMWTDLRTLASNHTNSIYFQRIDNTGAAVGSDLQIAMGGLFPRLVWTGSQYGLTWGDIRGAESEIYFVRLDANGQRIGSEVRVTNATGTSTFPAITWSGTSFELAWEDWRDGTARVYRTSLDANGVKTRGDVIVSCATNASHRPSIATLGTKIGIAWSDDRYGHAEVLAKLVDP